MMANGKDTLQRSWRVGKRIRKYGSFFRIRLVTGLQYRTAAWAGLCTQFFWGFLQIFIYQAFYAGTGQNVPMDFEKLVTYIWLQQALLTLVFVRIRDESIAKSIKIQKFRRNFYLNIKHKGVPL